MKKTKDILENFLIFFLFILIFAFVTIVPIPHKETIYIKSELICKEIFKEKKSPCKLSGYVKRPILDIYYNNKNANFIFITTNKGEYRINRKYLISVFKIGKE